MLYGVYPKPYTPNPQREPGTGYRVYPKAVPDKAQNASPD
jgi:hypothetical protein